MPDPPAPPLLRWAVAEADAAGAVIAVTTRHGGVSRPPYDTLNLGLHVGDDAGAVVANRSRAAAAFGAELADLVFARQVHGASAARVTPADAGRGTTSEEDALADTDIVVTTAPGVTLVILVADCVPLALVDPAAHVLAAVHAGWRGTAAGAVGAALRAMSEHGGRPERVVAFFGPAVAPGRYQVGDEVHEALAAAAGPNGLARAGRAARRPEPLDGGPGRSEPPPAGRRGGGTRPRLRERRHDGRPGLLQRPLGPALRAVRAAGSALRVSVAAPAERPP